MKKIHQIWVSDKNVPPSDFIEQKNNNLKEMYDDCDYTLYNDKDLISIIKNNFSKEVLLAYTKCKPYAFKSDLGRYCILYLYGGYYFDMSICPEFRYSHKDESFILKGESVIIDNISYELLDNGIMYFDKPLNKFLKSAIEKSVENILTHNYGKHPLDITGPMMLHSLNHDDIKKYPCSFNEKEKVIMIDNRAWFKYLNGFSSRPPFNNVNNYVNINDFGNKGTNSYSDMWFNKNVFKGLKQKYEI
jgi:hypothetical protein